MQQVKGRMNISTKTVCISSRMAADFILHFSSKASRNSKKHIHRRLEKGVATCQLKIKELQSY